MVWFRHILLFFALVLSGCVSTQVPVAVKKTIHIVDIEVTLDRGVKSTDSFSGKLKTALMNFAAYRNQLQSGRVEGYTLKVLITRIHYKDPVASMIVGDANGMEATSKLVDPTNGKILKQFKSLTIDKASAMINGVSGALLSIGVAKEKAEATLIKGISPRIMQLSYNNLPLNPKQKKIMESRDIFAPVTTPISPLSKPIESVVEVQVTE